MQPADRPPDLDLYAILGIGPRASSNQVRAAWRARVKASHPDVVPGEAAEERIRLVNLAWEWLGDPEQRRRYDLVRLARADAARGPIGPGRPGTTADEDVEDVPSDADDGLSTNPDGETVGGARPRWMLPVAATVAIALVAAATLGVLALNGRRTAVAPSASSVARPTTVVLAAGSIAPSLEASGILPGSPAASSVGSASPPSGTATGPTAGAGPSSASSASVSPAGPSSSPAGAGTIDLAVQPLALPVGDAPPECRAQALAATRLAGDVNADGTPDSIFFVGPCPDLAGGAGAPDRARGPYVYASHPGSGGPGPDASAGLPSWRLVPGAGAMAPGWSPRSAFIGAIAAAPAGWTDLGVELVATDGHTSALAVYRVSDRGVSGIWDSLRDGRAWQDATFSYAPAPAGGAATDGALLLVDAGPPGARVRQLFQWSLAGGSLELRLVDSGPAP